MFPSPRSISEGTCTDERANHLAMVITFENVECAYVDADGFQQ